ncbi:MAG: rhodanese-like domain-containing protein [Desulforhabdus sp.]|nr:rhodanese-like domain-containing protein [Desulforhabdus sp.]
MTPASERTDVRVMFPDDVQDFMREHQEGTYLLLDVRQPLEYEDAHLPGAKLIPLPKLPDSLDQLDRQKPVIVYCAVGGRSRMAAQLLSHRGFKDVSHLMGGIDAWTQPAASGPVELHLQFIRGDESPLEMISLGLRFEEGLKKFHEAVKERTTDLELADLLTSLIKAEESHKRTLLELLPKDKQTLSGQLSPNDASVMEGGIDVEDFLQRNKPYLQTVSGYLEMAMMVETQALDLYLRMAAACAQPETGKILLQISEEEKAHLAALGALLEQKIR